MTDFMTNLSNTLAVLKQYSVSVMKVLTSQSQPLLNQPISDSDEVIEDTSPHVLIDELGKLWLNVKYCNMAAAL